MLGIELLLPTPFWWGVVVILALYYGHSDDSTAEVVPGTKYLAMVTFLGKPLPFYRETGNYRWTGKPLGLGRVNKVVQEFTDENGFIVGGDIPFVVWNSSDSTSENRDIIEAHAKNDAVVKTTLTLVIRFVNPRKTLDSNDPALDIGNRARQEIREMFRAFVDTDIPNLMDNVGPVLRGKTLFTCFLPRAIEGYKRGSMIRRLGGGAIFKLAEHESGTPEYQQEMEAFREQVRQEADPEHLNLVSGNNPAAAFRVEAVKVEHPIEETLEALGLKLVRLSIASITLSPQVTEAAAVASAQTHELATQVA
ncbi:MAG: hypothetical protein KDD43_14460, partial [Bdellovibrionales bacterium]|nr:hypothetical protein [Bdellovibrionales bacterium]